MRTDVTDHQSGKWHTFVTTAFGVTSLSLDGLAPRDTIHDLQEDRTT